MSERASTRGRDDELASASIRPELIERVESGEGWDSALDKAILRAFGFTWRGMDYWSADNKSVWKGETCFTAKVDAVLSLIGQKLPGWWGSIDVGDWRDNPYGARLRLKENAGAANGRGATPARALLAACLRAIQSQAETLADATPKNPLSEGRERS